MVWSGLDGGPFKDHLLLNLSKYGNWQEFKIEIVNYSWATAAAQGIQIIDGTTPMAICMLCPKVSGKKKRHCKRPGGSAHCADGGGAASGRVGGRGSANCACKGRGGGPGRWQVKGQGSRPVNLMDEAREDERANTMRASGVSSWALCVARDVCDAVAERHGKRHRFV